MDEGGNDLGNSGSDLPKWMRGANDEVDGAGSGEMDFESEGSGGSDHQENDNDQDAATDNNTSTVAAAIDPKKLVSFILEQQPTFEDIPYNFPELLRQRKEEGKTWLELAREIGVPSTQISSKYSVYKKRVAKMMQDEGVA
ncbi:MULTISPECIES: hypothetical protein [Paenibacillus]|uniref:Uncharacterized protein n=1 Tax=Paenibacillus albilobatus TaxID=2716884 RepID=A0A919XJ52_9BACL|nr:MULTISPECIES: hypothetical protein [Paenibacillus]GIO33664.1 hypothetical protein J2TS6_48050 [Paenibacillus albilobatus]